MSLKVNLDHVLTFLFGTIIFILSRQVPFSFLSPIMNVCTLLLVVIYYYKFRFINTKINKQFTISMLLILLLHFYYSIIYSNGDWLTIIRFAIILFVLIVAFQINKLPKVCIKIFLYLQLIQSIVIIFFEMYMLIFTDEQTSNIIRHFVIEAGWGDVYSNGVFYHIQIRGNALLPFAYMILTITNLEFRRTKLIKLLILTGNVLAGNFAYLLIIILYEIFNSILNIRNSKTFFKWLIFLLISTMLFSIPLFKLFESKLESKIEGNSISERFEQTKLLTESLSQNELTFLFGNGLGYSLNKVTHTRDYRGSIYFEIQPLYFLSQMGILFFTLFLFFNFSLAFFNYQHNQLFLIFCCYWVYASINPYILDTNNFIVIIILNIINRRENTTISKVNLQF